MEIQELWSRGDEQQLIDFGLCLATDDLAGALFSLGGATAQERAEGRALLREMGTRIAPALPLADPRAQAEELCRVLVGELGFRPDDGLNYDFIALHRVLARRKGHPAILTALYREVAAAAGLFAPIVSSSGRLFLRLGAPVPVLVDPARGRALSAEDLAAGPPLPALPSDLPEASVADVVGRALKLAVDHCAASSDLVGLYRTLAFAAVLRPGRPLARLQQAAVAEQLGARSLAEEAYRAVAHDFPNTQESAIAALRLRDGRAPGLMQ